MFAKMLEMLGLKNKPETADVSAEVPEPARVSVGVRSRIYDKGYKDMLALARKAALSEDDELLLRLAEMLHISPVGYEQGGPLLIKALNGALEDALEDGEISGAQREALLRYLDRYDVFRADSGLYEEFLNRILQGDAAGESRVDW